MTMTATKEKPILFSAPMVRAILDGRKTQTRRVLSRLSGLGAVTCFEGSETTGYDWALRDKRDMWNEFRNDELMSRCPHGTSGDRLWVRETWGLHDTQPSDGPENATVYYRATDGDSHELRHQLWRPSIFMPRWASRITLEITDVRVQRVQEITEEDAIAEGSQCSGVPASLTNRGAFAKLWDKINAKRGYGWDANPWVWAISFKRV